MNPLEEIKSSFDRTMNNCRFYESKGDSLSLLNEIGCLRGLSYALEAFGECPHDELFIHLIELQQKLKAQ